MGRRVHGGREVEERGGLTKVEGASKEMKCRSGAFTYKMKKCDLNGFVVLF